MHHQKTKKCTKMFREKPLNSILIHFEFLNNNHITTHWGLLIQRGDLLIYYRMSLLIDFRPNFIFSNFKFQVEIYLHTNCPHVGLVNFVTLAYMFTKYHLLKKIILLFDFILNLFLVNIAPWSTWRNQPLLITTRNLQINDWIKLNFSRNYHMRLANKA